MIMRARWASGIERQPDKQPEDGIRPRLLEEMEQIEVTALQFVAERTVFGNLAIVASAKASLPGGQSD
jgi:hypothetical protein